MTSRAQTVTILFTDLVGSTELLQRAGDEQAQRIFKAHHRLLREAVEAHGGHEVKWLGDGLMVAFDSAADAVKCAIAMQQSSRRPTAGERLEIRAGLHVGEAFVDEADYFGTSVVIARRLCDKGNAGQILASDIVVRMLDGRGDGIHTTDLGALELKGITNPVPAVEIVYQHDPMALLRRLPFVGRDAEHEKLLRKLADARNGRGSVVLLAGEPGIGKTRLAEEFCDHASSGSTVIRGNCYEGDVAAPFGPWVEALKSLVNQLAADTLRDAVGAGASEIAVLVPALRQELQDTGEALKLDPEAERARLFDAVANLLRNASREKPLVAFLDDLHWCDRPSLALLEQVARNVANQHIVIVGTYRDVEVDRVHPLAQTLGALRRMEHHERIAIRGFTQDSVYELLNAIEPSEEAELAKRGLAQALYTESEGNPFFLREVLNNLIETGKLAQQDGVWTGTVASVEELGIPEGIKEVIGRRLSRLSETCNRMLARASAMTSGFTWEEVRAICDDPEDALLDALDEALGSQLISERDSDTYAFTHALIRATLYDELSKPRRVQLHRRIAESLESLYVESIDDHLGELAAHYMASVGSDTEKAIDYAVRAGRRAIEMVAWEEAAQHFERALEVMPAGGGNAERDCRVLLDLGEVLIYTGQASDAVRAYSRAAAIARDGTLPELLGEAASGLEEAGYFVLGDPDLPRQRLEIIDEALSLIDTRDSAIRARLLAQRTRPALALAGASDAVRTGGFGSLAGERNEEVVVNARDAVAMAERVGDPAVRAQALNYLIQALQGPATDAERRALAETQIQQATLAGNVRLLVAGYDLLFIPALAQGDMVAAREAHERALRPAEGTKIGWAIWSGLARRATLLLADGRLGESEAAAFEALSVGQANNATATQAFGGQLFAIRWCQGRLAEIAGMFKAIAEQSPNVGIYQAAVALIHAETGQMDEAQRVIDGLVARGLDTIPEDPFWKMTIFGLAEASVRLHRQDACAAFYDVAMRHPAGNVSAGNSVSLGAFARTLGQLAMVLERFDQAQHHFEDALDLNETMGHRPALAFTRLSYGDMLLRHNRPGDRDRAIDLLQQAHDFAKESGMGQVELDSQQLLASLA